MISVESPWNAFAKVSCKYRKRKNTVGIQREVGSLSVYLSLGLSVFCSDQRMLTGAVCSCLFLQMKSSTDHEGLTTGQSGPKASAGSGVRLSLLTELQRRRLGETPSYSAVDTRL